MGHLELVRLAALMDRTSGRPEISVGLMNGPPSSRIVTLPVRQSRGFMGRSGEPVPVPRARIGRLPRRVDTVFAMPAAPMSQAFLVRRLRFGDFRARLEPLRNVILKTGKEQSTHGTAKSGTPSVEMA